ncbi:MAG: glutaredoxin family protein, partial [Gammaproteobacteria bacterium]|nr:glutaredoxin family protein [Gammaproteobacteria bacterium]
ICPTRIQPIGAFRLRFEPIYARSPRPSIAITEPSTNYAGEPTTRRRLPLQCRVHEPTLLPPTAPNTNPQPSPRPMSKQLTVYVREDCHLCADMIDTLAEFQQSLNFTFVVRDIDCDPRLRAKYHALVPVLTLDDEEICHYFLDAVALRNALS